MKSVLISIKPKWCELIANGRKTIEVRKTRPKLETPFKCYIYCTLSELLTRSHYNSKIYVATNKKYQNELERVGNTTLSGKVIGEFICNKIDRLAVCGYDNRNTELRRVDDNLSAYNLDYDYLNKCRLSLGELKNYANGSELFGWHISDLVIYDKPKELSEFYKYCGDNPDCYSCNVYCYSNTEYGLEDYCCSKIEACRPVNRPPLSWCYVDEVEE